eukprot:TRINITY_DN1941_c0_g1_i3.p1 TRINITY_DN1941_c0_g1~~TRINITY_DN1941_c0_g1_i3.p1  ORF type:complete len:557 (+),score=97.67 TRINITY_DN1941_c0_g1_i3:363-2033(+)
MATSVHLDELFVIVGHIDGSITIYDRFTGERRRSPPTSSDCSLRSESRVMFVDRVGMFVITGGPKAFEVRKVNAPSAMVSHKLAVGTVEKVFLDQETGTIYAVVMNEGDSPAPPGSASDLTTWQPNYKEVNKKAESMVGQVASEPCDLYPPKEHLMSKLLKNWDPMDVVQWLAQNDLAEYRQTFFENHINGKTLSKLTDARMVELGVAAVGHRKRITTKMMQIEAAEAAKAAEEAALQQLEGQKRAASVAGIESSSDDSSNSASTKSSSSESSLKAKSSGLLNVVPIMQAVSENSRIAKAMKRASAGRPTRKVREEVKVRDRSATVSDAIPKLGTLAFEFQIIDTGDVITIPSEENKQPEISELVSQLCTQLSKPDLDPDNDIAVMIPSELGPIVLFEQRQLEDLIQKTLDSGELLVHLLVSFGRSTLSCNVMSPRANQTLQELQERVSLRRYPCLLVEAESNKIISLNALAQKVLRSTSSKLIGSSFDALCIGDDQGGVSSRVKKGGEEPSGLISWITAIQLGDGQLARERLVVRTVPLASGSSVLQIGIHDPDS